MVSSEEAKRLLAASKEVVNGSRPGEIHLRYCETLSVQPGWECLELFARAPEMAETIIALETQLGTVPQAVRNTSEVLAQLATAENSGEVPESG